MSGDNKEEKCEMDESSDGTQEEEISLDDIYTDSHDFIKDSQLDESSDEIQEEEISLDDIYTDSPDYIKDSQMDESSKKHQDEEIFLDDIRIYDSYEIEDDTLKLTEINEESQTINTLEDLQINEIANNEKALAGQDALGGGTFKASMPKPDAASKQETEQKRPNFSISPSVRNGGQSQKIIDDSAVNKLSKKIIAVGGAKGGVGKSMLSANLSIGLALLGKKVVLADLDLGGADVHLYTGVKSLTKTWNDFIDKKVDSISDILTPTAFKGLSLIGGDSSKLGRANIYYLQKLKIIRHLKKLDTDYLVIDLGGQTTYNVLDFFLLADHKIVISGTEPASVLDSYAFVKVVFNRFLERFLSKHRLLRDIAQQIKDNSLEKSKMYSLEYIFDEVWVRDPEASAELKMEFDKFRLSLILNMTEGREDLRIAETMQKLVKDKCFLDIEILGTIPFEKVVRQAARRFTPIVVENQKCQTSRNINKMLAAIISHGNEETTQSQLFQSTNRIRSETKNQIDLGKMILDGSTVDQINSFYNN